VRGAPHRVIVEAIIFLAICLTALGCFVYAVRKKRTEAQRIKLPVWRQVAIALGFLAVATQAAVFLAFWIWPPIGRDYVSFGQWARWVLPPFLVAVPCALAGKGASRWWLLSSSVLLFVICFFTVLSA